MGAARCSGVVVYIWENDGGQVETASDEVLTTYESPVPYNNISYDIIKY